MKAKNIALLILTLVLFISVPVFMEMDVDMSAVKENPRLDLATGEEWEKSFVTRRIWGENDNTVRIEMSSIDSGKYKVIVNGSNGYYAETEELTGPYLTHLEKTNPDVTYIVGVENQGKDNLQATLNVISFRR